MKKASIRDLHTRTSELVRGDTARHDERPCGNMQFHV